MKSERKNILQPNKVLQKMHNACEEVGRILKALSHPQRLMILGHLLDGEKTVSALVELCDVSQPQMSQFLVRMRTEGLVESNRRGRFQFYALADARLINLIKTIQKEYCR